MESENAGSAGAEGADRRDVILLAFGQHDPARHARVDDPMHDPDGKNDLAQLAKRRAHGRGLVALPDRHEEKRDQHRRKRELNVGRAHDHGIEPASEISREQPERDADDEGYERAAYPDDQGDAKSVKHGRIDAAPLGIGTEKETIAERSVLGLRGLVGPGGREIGVLETKRGQVVGILRRNPGSEQRRSGKQGEQRRRPDPTMAANRG